MTIGLQVVLLVFAVVGYGGAGASFAVSRYRKVADGERDLGMLGVSVMLFVFGALCTAVGLGFLGILAVGAVVVCASYALMAQYMGMFRIEASRTLPREEELTEESKWLD